MCTFRPCKFLCFYNISRFFHFSCFQCYLQSLRWCACVYSRSHPYSPPLKYHNLFFSYSELEINVQSQNSLMDLVDNRRNRCLPFFLRILRLIRFFKESCMTVRCQLFFSFSILRQYLKDSRCFVGDFRF